MILHSSPIVGARSSDPILAPGPNSFPIWRLSLEWKIERHMGNGFPLGVTPHSDTVKMNGLSVRKYMKMSYLDLRATKFRLQSLEDSLLEE